MRSFILFFLLFLVLSVRLEAQTVNDIKQRQVKSEKAIADLNKLLNEAKSNKTVSLNQLALLRIKIEESKRLISDLNLEINYLENQIVKNEKQISELITEKNLLLDLYGKLVYGLWKRKDRMNNLMFIFASSDFNQAYNRYKYFEQIQSYSKRQVELIHQLNDSLALKNMELKELTDKKSMALANINAQNKDLIAQQQNENNLLKQLRRKEVDIKKKLDAEKKNRQKLSKELDRLIAAQNKKSGSSGNVYKLTPEEKLVSTDFEKNKGRLPWPVQQGTITGRFGRNVHPLFPQVIIENNGVIITTLKDTDVRAVFNGVVSEIFYLKDLKNIVMIRHGSYLSIYSNLEEVTVVKGQQVTTKQKIGKVGFDFNKEASNLDFQIWKNMVKLNPELWLSK